MNDASWRDFLILWFKQEVSKGGRLFLSSAQQSVLGKDTFHSYKMTLFLGMPGNSDRVLPNYSFVGNKREAWEIRKWQFHGLKRLLLKQAFTKSESVLNLTLVLKLVQVVKHLEFVDFGRTAWNIDTAHSLFCHLLRPTGRQGAVNTKGWKHRSQTNCPLRISQTYSSFLQIKKRLLSCYFINSGTCWTCLQKAATERGHNDN